VNFSRSRAAAGGKDFISCHRVSRALVAHIAASKRDFSSQNSLHIEQSSAREKGAKAGRKIVPVLFASISLLHSLIISFMQMPIGTE
jgi:hypothetical protein